MASHNTDKALRMTKVGRLGPNLLGIKSKGMKPWQTPVTAPVKVISTGDAAVDALANSIALENAKKAENTYVWKKCQRNQSNKLQYPNCQRRTCNSDQERCTASHEGQEQVAQPECSINTFKPSFQCRRLSSSRAYINPPLAAASRGRQSCSQASYSSPSSRAYDGERNPAQSLRCF